MLRILVAISAVWCGALTPAWGAEGEHVQLTVMPKQVYCASDTTAPRWRFNLITTNCQQETLALRELRVSLTDGSRAVTREQSGDEINCLVQGSPELAPQGLLVLDIMDQEPEDFTCESVEVELRLTDPAGQPVVQGCHVTLLPHPTIYLRFPLEGRWLAANARGQQHSVGVGFGFDFIAEEDVALHDSPPGRALAFADFHSWGQTVRAPVAGRVVNCARDRCDFIPTPDKASMGGQVPADRTELLGNYVIIATEGGCHVLLAHLQYDSLQVTAGERVQEGQIIGQVGNSGNTSGPHLHLEVLDGSPDLAAILSTRFGQSGVPFGFRDVIQEHQGTAEFAERAVPERDDVLVQ